MITIQATPVSTHKTSHHTVDSVQNPVIVEDSTQAGTVKADHAAHKHSAPALSGIELPKPAVEASVENAGEIMSALQPYAAQTTSGSTAAALQILSGIFPASLLEAIQRDGENISPETEAQLLDYLSKFDVDTLAATLRNFGIELSADDAAQIKQILSGIKAPTPDYRYGVPANVNAAIDALTSLMTALLEIVQAAVKQKADSVTRAFEASQSGAKETIASGKSQLIGACVSGGLSTLVAIGGATQSVYGAKTEIDAGALRNSVGAGNGPIAAQARNQADVNLQTGKLHQEWGRFQHQHLSGLVSGSVKSGLDFQSSTHQSKGQVDNAAGQVHTSIADQQSQEISTLAAAISKILDNLSQYVNTQTGTIDNIVSNTRPV